MKTPGGSTRTPHAPVLPLASLPREVADSCAVLKRLCSRLSSIERPEATLLYAALMTTRAKLVHAGSWVGEGV